MSYTKHDFQSGDRLYASQLNEMDDMIYECDDAVKTDGAYRYDYRLITQDIILTPYTTLKRYEGTVVSTSLSTYFTSSMVDVEDAKYVMVNAHMRYRNAIYAFYGSDDSFISDFVPPSDDDYQVNGTDKITPPENAKKMRIASIASGTYKPYIRVCKPVPVYTASNRIEALENDFKKFSEHDVLETLNTVWTSGKIIRNGNATDYSQQNYCASDYIDIEGYERVYVSANANWGNSVYEIYDKDKTLISSYASAGQGAQTVLDGHEVTVAYNAKYIRLAKIVSNAATDIYGVKAYAKKAFDIIDDVNKLLKPWSGKKWVCVGDSLTELNSRTTMHYHDYIADATGITVVNMGKSGSGYKRREDENFAFYQRVSAIPTDADVVTIFGSGNDGTYVASSLGTPSDTGTDTLCGCINTTIDNIIALIPTVQLGIVSPTPWVGQQPNSTSRTMYKMVEALKTICEYRSIPFLDMYHCSNLRPWTEEGRTACYTKDDGNGVHPDETGHKIIASRFKAFLESLII